LFQFSTKLSSQLFGKIANIDMSTAAAASSTTVVANKTDESAERDEFRSYLEQKGVIDALTKGILGLYIEPEKPANPLEFLTKQLASALGGGDQLRKENDELKTQNLELKKKIEELQKQVDQLLEKKEQK